MLFTRNNIYTWIVIHFIKVNILWQNTLAKWMLYGKTLYQSDYYIVEHFIKVNITW
jgi:hypothetical protein